MTSKSPFPNTNAAITISKLAGPEPWTLQIGGNIPIVAKELDGLAFDTNNIATANGQLATQFETKPQKSKIEEIVKIVQKIQDATKGGLSQYNSRFSSASSGNKNSAAKAALQLNLKSLNVNSFYAGYAAVAAAATDDFFKDNQIQNDGYGKNVKAGMTETYNIATAMKLAIDNTPVTDTDLAGICGTEAGATATYLALEKFTAAIGETITKVTPTMQDAVKTAYITAKAAAAAAPTDATAAAAATKAGNDAAATLKHTAYEADAAAAAAVAADWTVVADKWKALYAQIGGTDQLTGGKKTRHNRNRNRNRKSNRNRRHY